MGSRLLHTDIAIIGGGIAGLWALNLLRNRGYSALLFEQDALGSRQTIDSQGMIHGGIKYSLSGALTRGSESLAAMPATWRDCLAGRGAVDLRGCRVLSDNLFLWTPGGLEAQVSAFLAGRALRGQVEKLERANYPAPLRSEDFRGQVYRLAEPVLDVPSLVETLASRHREAIYRVDWERAALVTEQGSARLLLGDCSLSPRRLLLTAGAGNEHLLARLGAQGPAMQRRPLHQVLVQHQYREAFFGHCLGRGTRPRLTVSSHRTAAGEPVWYLGGELAEAGCDVEPDELIARAREELVRLLPWLDLGETRWRTLRVDRAEPRQAGLLRPDGPFVETVPGLDNTLVAWPTKLTLGPALADALEQRLRSEGVVPTHRPDLSTLAGLERPRVAESCWERLFP